MVAGDGKSSLDSVESVETSEDTGELGGWLESGVVGGVKIHGVFLILRIQCLQIHLSQKTHVAKIEKTKKIV